jgi:hypothetical protein
VGELMDEASRNYEEEALPSGMYVGY